MKPIFPGLSLFDWSCSFGNVGGQISFQVPDSATFAAADGTWHLYNTAGPGLWLARGALPKFHPPCSRMWSHRCGHCLPLWRAKCVLTLMLQLLWQWLPLDNSCNQKFAPEIRVGSESLSLPSCPASTTWATSLESWLGCGKSSLGWPYFRLVKYENLPRSMRHPLCSIYPGLFLTSLLALEVTCVTYSLKFR